MPINTNLNTAPYFDDYDLENQYYRVLFKPGYAVQARELTQLQTMLQNQVEQFGDNIFKEGSIVKGCNFTRINSLQFVKLVDKTDFDASAYIPRRETKLINGSEREIDVVFEVEGLGQNGSGLKAQIISASIGVTSRPPDLNTFFIRYLNETEDSVNGQFIPGEPLTIYRYEYIVGELQGIETNPITGPVAVDLIGAYDGSLTPAVGSSFGIEAAPGIIFQKGHFLFASPQTLIVEKYSDLPDLKNVGYRIRERLTNARQDNSLYDNANGSANANAPGADRLKLIPELVSLDSVIAEADASFFSLVRYLDGNAVTLRDISQYNVIGEEMARRTYEESGNYILSKFDLKTERKENTANTAITDLRVTVGTGIGYVKGYRVENKGESSYIIEDIVGTDILENQPISYNYGGWYKCTFAGTPPAPLTTVVDLRNSSDVNIGTAYIHAVLPGKVFLTGIEITSGAATDVDNIFMTGVGQLDIDGTFGFQPQEHKHSELVFDSGLFSSKETTGTTIPVRDRLSVTTNGGTGTQVIINAAGNDNFAGVNSIEDVLVLDTGTNNALTVTGVSTNIDGDILTVTLSSAGSGSGVMFYNKLRNLSSSGPYAKTSNDTFIRTTYVSSKRKYSLGIPDVYEIVQILDQNGDDYTDSFRLVTNQKDRYYDWSYIEYIDGRQKPVNGVMSVQFKVFQINTGTGEYFFTINSYPLSLDANEIPGFTASSGKKYSLRDCFDFRPYLDKSPSVAFSVANAAAATVFNDDVGSNTPTIGGDYSGVLPIVPSYKKAGFSDIEHYLSRVDALVIDSYGITQLIQGEEERYAKPPKISGDQLLIGEVTIPGVPALTPTEAVALGKRNYAVKAKQTGVTNYTMKDLHSLEKKIENMAYYISLSQLESSAANLTVRDANGLTRFKNGFIADPMNDLGIADIKNPEFNAAIRFNQKILTPSVKEFPIDLIYANGSNTQRYPSPTKTKVVTLSKNTDLPILTQPFATEFRNCVSNFYNFAGRGQISPPYDATYDTTVNPVQIDIDVAFPTEEIIDNIQQFQPLTDTDVQTSGVNSITGGGVETTTTASLELVGETVTSTDQYIGDFITNTEFLPYMAAREIRIFMVGLRPNTRHYFYFDKVNVDQYIKPGSTDAFSADDVRGTGSAGDAVSTDANGILRATFQLPAATFFVGDRVLEIADVDQYSSIESAGTSGGFVTYRAYNFSVEKSAVTATTTTRTPEFEVLETTTTRNLPSRPAPPPRPVFPVFRRGDPLAQTFFIKGAMGKGSDSVYVSKIDLYFKRKSSTNGVTVMLREVSNGYPAPEILPFSEIHLTPNQVTVSDDASATTAVIFEAPVRLDTEKEYCVVVMPDANDPNYLIFTSKVGGSDLSPGATQGQSVVQDWGDGILFTSTNNRAWKSYQDEDIKFTLYRNNFDQSTGTVVLTNNNHEFLTVENINGAFIKGETIYQIKPTQGGTGAQVSIGLGSTTVSGSALDDTYVAGDYIGIGIGAVLDIFRVVSVDSSTELTVDHAAGQAYSNATANPLIVGNLCYYDIRNSSQMYLEASSATSGRTLDVAGIIYGRSSGSNATISSIDNIELSFFTPFIARANDSVTKMTVTGAFVDPLNTSVSYSAPVRFNDLNHFNQRGCLLYSHSNDPAKSNKFELTVNMQNSGNQTSTPIVDVEVSKLMATTFNVTDTAETSSKYISKSFELNDDFDAEDFQVNLTGYRPNGTNIAVYFRGQSASDTSTFTDVPWVEMDISEGADLYSSTGNMNDFREWTYKLPASALTGGSSDVYRYTSPDGTFDGFRRWSIKISLTSDRKGSVPFVKDYRAIALT